MTTSNDGPALVVTGDELSAVDQSPMTMAAIPGSRMFEIREALSVYRERHPGERDFDASQGDGGASLPGVPDVILDEAHRLQKDHGTGYDKPFGTEDFRRAVVEDYWALDSTTGWGTANVIACQGGRDALLKAYEAIQFLGHGRRGDFIVVSRVPWISYNWGPYAVGANVMLAPGDEDDAWALTPQGIAACCDEARRLGGRKVAAVVITTPDNPTGRSLSLERQVELARAAFALGIPFVILDWIYHRVSDGNAHDLNLFLSRLEPSERERCIILDGITKSLGGSNIRNAHLLASAEAVRFMQGRASHGVIPSFHSQAVAVAAYRMGFDKAAASIIDPTNRSRKVLAKILGDNGIRHVIGQGYYAFIDVGPSIDRTGLGDSAGVGARLAEDFGLAVVPGVYFSDFGARWVRFSYAQQPAYTEAAGQRLIEALGAL
ncbi:MAG: pyridoxal phosphate-dependent aminotransferase [Acidobacteriota bacterium]